MQSIYALDYIRNKPNNFAFLGDNEGSGAQGALTAGSGITLFNDTISTEYTILPISQSDYNSLQTKDPHTLYIITT